MDLYTMNENFIADKVVDEFQSAIWTERYWAAGEVQIVAPVTPEYLSMLKEGTFLGKVGTDEVMQIQTNSIENNLVTVVGKSLLAFTNERIHWSRTTDSGQPVGDYTPPDDIQLGTLLADRATKMLITPEPFTGSVGSPWPTMNLDWDSDKIPSLELGAVDTTGTAKRWTVPIGPFYSVTQPLAQQDELGIRLYLESADSEVGFVLKFATYRGVDHTSDNPDPDELIRLTPNLDNLTNVKEVNSIDGYKNVVYVVYQNEISTHYEDPGNIPTGFNRRVMIRDAVGEPIGTTQVPDFLSGSGGYYGGGYIRQGPVVGPADILKFREQNAKDALANNNYIKAVDGQVSQINNYKFGVDYGMGDILELEGLTGNIQKARVTEYIHAQDATGEREYPTLSVITEPAPFPV